MSRLKPWIITAALVAAFLYLCAALDAEDARYYCSNQVAEVSCVL